LSARSRDTSVKRIRDSRGREGEQGKGTKLKKGRKKKKRGVELVVTATSWVCKKGEKSRQGGRTIVGQTFSWSNPGEGNGLEGPPQFTTHKSRVDGAGRRRMLIVIVLFSR